MKHHTGITAVLTKLGKKKKTADDDAQYAFASQPYLAIIGAVPRPLSEAVLSCHTQKVQAWLCMMHGFDFRTIDPLDHNVDDMELTLPVCDTRTEWLLLTCAEKPFYVDYASAPRPIHKSFLRLQTQTPHGALAAGTGSLTASTSDSPTGSGSSTGSSSGFSSSSRHTPAEPPSCVFLLGRIAVAPLVGGQHSRNGHEPTNFAAVIDAADPALPLWAVWAERVMDYVRGEYLAERPHASNPFYRVLLPAAAGPYDAVLLGRLADARLRRGTVFPLAAVVRCARRSRARCRPSLHRMPEAEAVATVAAGWKAGERRRIWKRRFSLSL